MQQTCDTALGQVAPMDNSEISRRETLRLARFGVLLAAGLGVIESAPAAQYLKGRYDTRIIKGTPGDMLLKFYSVEPDGDYSLLKTTELKSRQLKLDFASFEIKFWRGNMPLTTVSDVMQKG